MVGNRSSNSGNRRRNRNRAGVTGRNGEIGVIAARDVAAGAETDNKMYFFQLQKEPEGSFCL